MAAQRPWPHGTRMGAMAPGWAPGGHDHPGLGGQSGLLSVPGVSGSGTGRTRDSPSTRALFTQLLQLSSGSSGNFLAGINLGYKWPCLQLPLREVTFPTCERRLHPGGVHGGLGSGQRAQKTH